MQPIHELLARIRWDTEFSRARFELAYWDRMARELQRISLDQVGWESANPSLLAIVDAEGVARSIPFHRVRKVWRDGVLIWDRDVQGRPN